MSKDLTHNFPPHSFEARVLAELVAMQHEFSAQRQETSAQFASIREESSAQFASVRQELASIRQELAEQREMIQRLHARVVLLETRLTALEEKVEERLREARPIWESVLARLTSIETEMSRLNRHFRTLTADFFSLRVHVDKLEGESV